MSFDGNGHFFLPTVLDLTGEFRDRLTALDFSQVESRLELRAASLHITEFPVLHIASRKKIGVFHRASLRRGCGYGVPPCDMRKVTERNSNPVFEMSEDGDSLRSPINRYHGSARAVLDTPRARRFREFERVADIEIFASDLDRVPVSLPASNKV